MPLKPKLFSPGIDVNISSTSLSNLLMFCVHRCLPLLLLSLSAALLVCGVNGDATDYERTKTDHYCGNRGSQGGDGRHSWNLPSLKACKFLVLLLLLFAFRRRCDGPCWCREGREGGREAWDSAPRAKGGSVCSWWTVAALCPLIY